MVKAVKTVAIFIFSFLVINVMFILKANAANLADCYYHDPSDSSRILRITINEERIFNYQIGTFEQHYMVPVPTFVASTTAYTFTLDTLLLSAFQGRNNAQAVCTDNLKFTIDGTSVSINYTEDPSQTAVLSNYSTDEGGDYTGGGGTSASATCYYNHYNVQYLQYVLVLNLKSGKDTIEGITFSSSDYQQAYDDSDVKFDNPALVAGHTFEVVGITRDDFNNGGSFGCPTDIIYKFQYEGKYVYVANVTNPDAEKEFIPTLDESKSIIDDGDDDDDDDKPGGGETPTGEPINCEDFTIEEKDEAGTVTGTVNLVRGLFTLIMILAPILLVVFGSVDFAKATLAADEKALKKAGTNFSKRVIATALLFMLPLIINLIIGVAHEAGVFGTYVPEVCLKE